MARCFLATASAADLTAQIVFEHFVVSNAWINGDFSLSLEKAVKKGEPAGYMIDSFSMLWPSSQVNMFHLCHDMFFRLCVAFVSATTSIQMLQKTMPEASYNYYIITHLNLSVAPK